MQFFVSFYFFFSFLPGSADQIQYLVSQGCIPPLCDLLTVMDPKIVQLALTGLENILRFGEQDAAKTDAGGGANGNPYANAIEECYGLDKIEFLQSHENMEIYQKAFDIIEKYFSAEEDDARVAPSVDADGQNFTFGRAGTDVTPFPDVAGGGGYTF